MALAENALQRRQRFRRGDGIGLVTLEHVAMPHRMWWRVSCVLQVTRLSENQRRIFGPRIGLNFSANQNKKIATNDRPKSTAARTIARAVTNGRCLPPILDPLTPA